MKILALVSDGLGAHGGIARYNQDLMAALAGLEQVETVDLLARTGQRSAEAPAKLRVHAPRASRLSYSLRAVILALQRRPDIVFCGHLYMAPLARFIAWFLRRPLWLQLHGIEAWDKPGSFAWSPSRRAAENASLVTSVSRHTRRGFLSWARVAPERARVLPNTYEPPLPAASSREALKQKYGLAGAKVLLTVSRIDVGDRYKGHDRVLAALPELIRRHPELRYLVVGDGDDRPRLNRIVEDTGLSRHVRFMGRVGGSELEDCYRLADAYVMPSTKEGFGIVFLEAASFGLPVVAGDADGSVDALAEGRIGRCVDPGDGRALVEAIDGILTSAAPREPSAALQRFSRSAFSAHIARLLSDRASMSFNGSGE